MATYLQGETGIIPSIQPFDPNINLIGSVLQQKDTQFDNNFKQLNKVYNTYVFSELSRTDNTQKRDALVKQIDLDLKRMATLDLSQEKNVNQAVRVFAPLYEDQYIMTDMAKTKNYNSRRSSAMSLNQSRDKEKRSQYWGTGVKYMDYMMEEFKSMPLEQTLGSPDITYTPFVNIAEKLSKLAKDNNLNVEVDSFTKDGLYIVTDKNGSLLVDPLTRLFSANLANDPAVQDIYRVRSYVDRKDYASINKDRVGSLEGAEQEYLITKYNELKSWSQKWNNQNNQDLADKQNTITNINKSYKDGTYTDQTDQALAEQEESKARIQSEVDQSSGILNDLSDGESSTVSLTKEGIDITQNIDLLRNVVDNGVSMLLMQNDIIGAAETYSKKDVKHKINVNQVGLEGLRHSHRMSEIDRRASRNDKAIVLKANLDSGVWVSDMYGTVGVNPELTARLQKTFDGTTTGGVKATKVNAQYERDLANEQATPAVNMMFEYLENEVTGGRMSEKQAGAFFSYKGKTLNEVKEIYDRDPGGFFTKRGFSADKTINDFTKYVQTNKKGDRSAEAITGSQQFATFNQYAAFTKAARNVNQKNIEVARKMVSEGVYEAGLASDYNYFSKDVVVNLTQTERQLLNKKLPALFINNTSGPVSEESFRRAVMKDKELQKVVQKIGFSRQLQTATKQGNVGAAGIGIINKAVSSIMGARGEDDFIGRVYDTYNANWDTKKDGTKFKSYYVGKYVPGVNGSEFALTAPEGVGLTVFPNAYGTPNRTIWTETMEDVNNMSRALRTGADSKISFGGIGKSNSNDTQTGLAVLSYLNSKMAGKDKPKNFEIYSSQIAQESASKGAMIIYPSADDLTGLVGNEKNPGLITAEERNNILKNGISIIAPRNKFNNFLMKEGNLTPMEAIVNAGGYEYKNPGGAGSFSVRRTDAGYAITGNINQRNVNTGKMESSPVNQISAFGQFGNNIDTQINQFEQSLVQLEQQNNQIYRKYNQDNK
jgi:hypothetical protein